jgi:hypothetical protein
MGKKPTNLHKTIAPISAKRLLDASVSSHLTSSRGRVGSKRDCKWPSTVFRNTLLQECGDSNPGVLVM